MRDKKRIFYQMFDVRPVNEAGDLDMEKIKSLEKIVRIYEKSASSDIYDFDIAGLLMEDIVKTDTQKYFLQNACVPIRSSDFENVENVAVEFKGDQKNYSEENENDKYKKDWRPYIRTRLLERVAVLKRQKIPFFYLGKIFLALSVILLLFNFISIGLKIKNGGLAKGQEALAELEIAESSIKNGNFKDSYAQFAQAYEKLNEISQDLDGWKKIIIEPTKYFPYLSKISSASHLVTVGNDISKVGMLLSETLGALDKIKSGGSQDKPISYLELFKDNEERLKEISGLLGEARDNLDDVNIDDIPSDKRNKLMEMKERLPEINAAVDSFLAEERIFTDILGGNGPRKYLFLFQNNQEMRATGGFIGSYGVLDIFNGRVRKFFIDGIFNPDGQLREKVVPPLPIQKISASWSLHDSNWFPDFPVSAEKAAWFYEKTGGPTVDGVITMTPTVMQKLLEVTGPIDMPEYEVVVDKDNFIEKIQYKVETDYDKELNQPKKILADLAPKILDKLFNASNFSDLTKTMDILLKSLNEKHILIYSKNWEIEKILSENGWTGEILTTAKDYLSVINTNINGFKTDGVIEEKISHQADIQLDGTIIDTVTVTRKHNGGDTEYDWWNRVNSNYMRLYVPKGSKLITVEGQTRELNTPPLDYNMLGYRKDPQVQMEENSIDIDPESGTRIYEDKGKTVFANWVYVSPKESAEIKYTYVLPFKVKVDGQKKPLDTYSLLIQKQSGSIGSQFVSEISYPDSYSVSWEYPENNLTGMNGLPDHKKGIKMETDLITDNFVGLAFSQN